ncbi:MAG: NAD(P)-binding domain-containing protein [Bacteroidetes bacterium]|nr:NAD(P)-binding domain-containing protein [Bacteroidota bacterium]
MKIGILGTGIVGQTIGSKLIHLGNDVMLGSRMPNNEKAIEWTKQNGSKASHGTFAQAAAFGNILFNCTSGAVSLDALNLAGKENLNGKILIDVANPLDFSKGMPPSLTVCNTDSLGEQIQKSFPEVKVVKALNTMNCKLMVDPSALDEDHDVFMCGNNSEAKSEVAAMLKEWFGWKTVIDLGDITAARGTEMILPLWLRLMGVLQTPNFNFKIVR